MFSLTVALAERLALEKPQMFRVMQIINAVWQRGALCRRRQVLPPLVFHVTFLVMELRGGIVTNQRL